MSEEKKAKDALIAIMLGDIGELHDAVKSLPAEMEVVLAGTKGSLDEFVQAVPAVLEQSEAALKKFDARTENLYEKLVGIQTDLQGEREKLGAQMENVQRHAISAGTAVGAMQNAVGDMTQQAGRVVDVLDNKTQQMTLAVNSLNNLQLSKLSGHGVAVSNLKTLAVVLVAFTAGVGFNPAVAPLAVVAIGVGGVAVGWVLGWFTSR